MEATPSFMGAVRVSPRAIPALPTANACNASVYSCAAPFYDISTSLYRCKRFRLWLKYFRFRGLRR
eukprot:1589088-Rhodomonas_salina.1